MARKPSQLTSRASSRANFEPLSPARQMDEPSQTRSVTSRIEPSRSELGPTSGCRCPCLVLPVGEGATSDHLPLFCHLTTSDERLDDEAAGARRVEP
jgi:hypothetical protein